MSSFEVLGVDHVTITAPEELEEETVSWYGDCLRLERLEKPEGTRSRGAWFRCGDEQIHVAVDAHNPHKSAHFGIVVDGFESIVEALRASGCHIEQATLIPGRRRCFTRDPAGNNIEIMSFTEASAVVDHEEPVGGG